MPKFIKCRFCKWKAPTFTTTSKGKTVHNYHRLQEHCIAEHNEELKKYNLLTYEGEDEFDQFSNNLIERR